MISPITAIAALVMAVLVLAFVGYPLLQSSDKPQGISGRVPSGRKREQAGTAIELLSALESDRQLGKVSEEEYLEIQNRYLSSSGLALAEGTTQAGKSRGQKANLSDAKRKKRRGKS